VRGSAAGRRAFGLLRQVRFVLLDVTGGRLGA
jgi:hypothetical protein